MKKVYIYKTKDGTSFDVKNEALRHERKTILQEIFSTLVIPDDDRSRIIGAVLGKFDAIVEAFEAAEVMDADDED